MTLLSLPRHSESRSFRLASQGSSRRSHPIPDPGPGSVGPCYHTPTTPALTMLRNPRRACLRLALFAYLPFALSCASVPKEVVELSYAVGEDLSGLHASYRSLIVAHFDHLRAERTRFIETQWRPVFLERFIQRTGLVELVDTLPADEVPEMLDAWTHVALDTIAARRDMLTSTLDRDEAELLKVVDQAFSNVMWANATITSHLNSIREVEDVQDRALESLNLTGLRERIDEGLVRASESAAEILEAFKEAEGMVERAPNVSGDPGLQN